MDGVKRHINAISSRLGSREREEYGRIFAPKTVAVPPGDAKFDTCITADGEIRAYGWADLTEAGRHESGRRVYISSLDGGLSWAQYDAHPNDIGACVYVPWTGKYIVVKPRTNPQTEKYEVVCYMSDTGAGDIAPQIIHVSDMRYQDIFLPFVLCERKRIIVTCMRRDDNWDFHPSLLISDDGGLTFKIKEFAPLPRYVAKPPHKGPRWNNNGAEPSVSRLSDGRLWLIIRTSEDYMYESFSYDDGDTWETPHASRFHMTLTTPYALTLTDGRTVLFWNDTHPMPEIDKSTILNEIDEDTRIGNWEDVFTNRDAAHAAITEDGGKTFLGLRETMLNSIRHASDFRAFGGFYDSIDRSVHQFQALELPMGKILLCAGQHAACRRIVIFDTRWLYETTASESFVYGYGNVSVQGYLKSVSASQIAKGYVGHCQWNRVPSVLPAPDPCGSCREVMQFVFSDDPRLFNGISGMAWNFPAAKKGRIELELLRLGAGLKISLADEWINPTDPTVSDVAEFSFEVEKALPKGSWQTLAVEWNVDASSVVCSLAGEIIAAAELKHDAPFGVCYLHLQTLARERDYEGCFLSWIKKL